MPGTISFTNRFDHTLDSKNRLMVPQAYREIVEKAEGEIKFFLTRGFEKCLAMYSGSTWERMRVLLETRKAEEVAEIKSRRFFRLFYGSAVEVTPDRTGRILIPEHLKKVAGLEKKVVLIGVSDRIEL
ncbi:MAG TPA: division/cell wall cluster transcriptional repressor MraZ, partial [Planctomycetota bacterium]|nr:division/cell wall cluster transcriptional repressor MraZ [Planctomycetota bacterium]